MSVCYRDAWGSTHPGEPGHSFTAENPLVTAENWDWELGRRIDHIFVRCSAHFGFVADLSAQTSGGRPAR